jgi:nucleoid DNA-binding protein
MSTISKRDLVNQLSNQSGLSRAETYTILALLMENITDHLASNREVVLRNFGTFEVRVTKAKIGRNPKAPEKAVPIPARTIVNFVPGKELREQVAELLPNLTR